MSNQEILKFNQEILKPLVDRVLELSTRPEEGRKKQLWARHNALQPTDKIPVCLTYGSIRDLEWDLMFGEGHLQCRREDEHGLITHGGIAGTAQHTLARHIEFHLKKVIWMAENVPDDHVVWPAMPIPALYNENHQRWGVDLRWHTGGDLGSAAIVVPFPDEVDWSKLRIPQTEVDETATSARLVRASELVDGRLTVYPQYQTLGESPFEWVVRMRGLEQIHFDVYDHPELVHRLMDFVTRSIIADHQRREDHGWLNFPPDPSGQYQMETTFRHIASYVPSDCAERKPLLIDEWPYVSAQSAAGFGPAMYEEFVHQYNCRLADLFAAKTVYYHGCENLDQKLDIIATLPNLGRHHVSPWSSVAVAAQKYQGSVVLEVHSHPTKIAMAATREELKNEVASLVDAADGHPMNLCLTDTHSLGGDPDTLRRWAQVAQEVACP